MASDKRAASHDADKQAMLDAWDEADWSDERAAVPYDQQFVHVEGQQTMVHLRIATLKLQLAEQGLHVVTDAEMAVLEACAELHEQALSRLEDDYTFFDIAAAELARREATR